MSPRYTVHPMPEPGPAAQYVVRGPHGFTRVCASYQEAVDCVYARNMGDALVIEHVRKVVRCALLAGRRP